MSKQRRLLWSLLISLLAIGYGCQSEKESVISGKIISFSYGLVDTVGIDAWLKIDDTKFIHSPHSYDWKNDLVLENEKEGGYYAYLPTTKSFFYRPGHEKRHVESVGAFNITAFLSKKLSKRKDKRLIYQNVQPTALSTKGELIIKRKDNQKIKVTKSPDCPVKIVVLQK
ncbi:MAG: hypothetical protein AB8G15_19440 [Saprospiraceae bacterium]